MLLFIVSKALNIVRILLATPNSSEPITPIVVTKLWKRIAKNNFLNVNLS